MGFNSGFKELKTEEAMYIIFDNGGIIYF